MVEKKLYTSKCPQPILYVGIPGPLTLEVTRFPMGQEPQGIEPQFQHRYERKILTPKGELHFE